METLNLQFMSAEINEISAALSAFQGSIKQPPLNKEVLVQTTQGRNYTFKYADLSTCITAAAAQLKENGLSVVQLIQGHKLITILAHKSGQWFRSEADIRIADNASYQALGSALTYLKRYSYCAILGIAADIDDDANAACGNHAEFTDSETSRTEDKSQAMLQQALAEISNATSTATLKAIYDSFPELQQVKQFRNALNNKGKMLKS